MKYTMKIYLDRFIHTDVIEHDIDGRKMKGIFIPFAPNNIYVNRGGYVAYFYVKELTGFENDATHYLTQSFTKKQQERLKEKFQGRKITVGYMTPLGKGGNKALSTPVDSDNIDTILNNH